jgi:23S rRNA pseudouridine2605 synthase
MASERLQKYLAGAGITSRRKAEALITAGRVKVNEKVVTELGTKIDPGKDLVTVDGGLVEAPEQKTYLMLYKPSGCVTTASDPEGRPTANEYLSGVRNRVFAVGRLDYDAEGALLFTDDGELANRLAHPRYGHRRVYLVKVKGEPQPEALLRMKAGVRLEDGPAQALEVVEHERAEKNVWIRVVVAEGRYHLVKRLCEAVGLQVQRLFRPEFGGITVDGLRPGFWRILRPEEIRGLRQRVGLEGGAAAPLLRGGDLPKAARRHGHGPPLAPGRAPPPEPERGPDDEGDGEVRAPAPQPARAPRDERPQKFGRPHASGGKPERRGPSAGPGRGGRGGRDALGRGGRDDRPARSARPGTGFNGQKSRGPRPSGTGERSPATGSVPERRQAQGRNQGGSARTEVPPARSAAKKGSSKKW